MKLQMILPLALALIFAACSNSVETGGPAFEKGMNFIKAGEIENALAQFDKLVEDNPESPFGYYGRAVAYSKEGLLYEAINANYQAVRLQPDFTVGHLLNAQLFLKINRPELAFFSISLYQEKGGDPATGLMLELTSLIDAGKIDEAADVIEKNQEKIEADPGLLLTRGRHRLHNGDFTGGLADCRQALSLGNDDPGNLHRVGHFYRRLGLYDSAASYYEKALEVRPDDVFFMADIADAFVEMHYFHRALQILENFAAKASPNHRYYLALSNLEELQGKLNQAAITYGKARPLYDESPTVLSFFAEKYSAAGYLPRGILDYELALELANVDEYPTTAMFELIRNNIAMLHEFKKFDRAVPLVQELLDSLPNDFHALHAAAMREYVYDKTERLTEMLERLNEVTPGMPANQAVLGKFYMTLDSMRRAHEIFRQVLNIDRFNLTAITGEAKLLAEMESPGEALAFINSFDEYVSYVPEVAHLKLELYKTTDDKYSATTFAQELIDIAVHDLGRYETAYELALAYDDTGKAQPVLTLCLENNPENAAAYTFVAEAGLSSGKRALAEANVEKALELDSLYAPALFLRARLYDDEGRKDKAIEQYQKVIDVDQYFGEAWGNLATLLFHTDTNLLIPVNYIRKAISVDDGNPEYHYMLGRIYNKMGKYALARGGYQTALKLAPENSVYNYYAGLNYMKEEKFDQARQHLRKAIDLGLPGDLKSEARKTLNKL